MTYSFVLKSGETWTSSHLPMVPPWSPYAGDETNCTRCADNPEGGELYEHAGGPSHYCKKCYTNYTSEADRLGYLPVSFARPWFTNRAWMYGWRVATKPQALLFLAFMENKIPPGSYPEIGEIYDTVPDHDPRKGLEFTDLMTNALSNPYAPWVRIYASFTYRDHNFITPMACSVCGRGGQMQEQQIGWFHGNCWNWFSSDALEAEGFVTMECGHVTRPVALTQVYFCVDCGDQVDVLPCKLCNKVDLKQPRCGMHQAFYTHGKGNQTSGVVVAKVDASFNMFRALADFYILSDLHERAPALVEAEYVRRVQEIANEMARYTIMATGGEARHWASRNATDSLCVVPLPEGEEVEPEQTYCAYCQITNPTCNMHQTSRRKVVHYHGVNVNDCPNKKSEQVVGASITHTSMSKALKIDGQFVQLQSSRALWEPFNIVASSRGDRSDQWGKYVTAYRKHGLPVLDACVIMFNTGEWSPAYGGPKWGRAASLVRDYVAGKINPPVFIDCIFGVQHNGGSLFNKVYLLKVLSYTLRELLDTRRSMTSTLVLLPWASVATRWQWIAVAMELKDPELQLGVKLWQQAAVNGVVTAETFSKQLALYHNKAYYSGKWEATAKAFRLKVADRPAWRKRPRKKAVSKVVAVEKMAVLAGVTA